LLPGGLGQVDLVLAASQSDSKIEYNVWLSIRLQDNPLCANQSYAVTVVPMSQTIVTEADSKYPQINKLDPTPVSGVKIEAFSSDKSVATISPPTMVSGFDLEDALPGAARFEVKTGKAGSANLIFEGLVKPRFGNAQYVGPTVPITVI